MKTLSFYAAAIFILSYIFYKAPESRWAIAAAIIVTIMAYLHDLKKKDNV